MIAVWLISQFPVSFSTTYKDFFTLAVLGLSQDSLWIHTTTTATTTNTSTTTETGRYQTVPDWMLWDK